VPTVGLLPAVLDIAIYSGDLCEIPFVFNDEGDPLAVPPVDPAPIDMSGFSFAAQIRLTQTDVSAAAGVFSIDTSDAAAGRIVLTLTPAQTVLLIPAAGGRTYVEYTWDLQRSATGDANDVRTLFAGTVKCYLDRTRLS
jgi:hypothetical protein